MNLIEKLEMMIEDARRVYESNKKSGSPAVSVAYDHGRIEGLREALAEVEKERERK